MKKVKTPVQGGVAQATVTPKRTVVLHVLPQDLNRGAQIYAGKLRDALHGDQTQSHLVATLFASPTGGARPDVALDVRPGFGRKIADLRAAMRLRRLIRSCGASLVVAHGGEALKYALLAAGRRPTLYYKVGLSTAEIQRPAHRMFYRFLTRRTACVVGNSKAILAQVSALFNIPASRQALIPNGRDPEVYRPLESGELPANPARILFVGQFEDGKRPQLFLDAIELLREEGGAPFEALMAGDGPLRKALGQRATSLGVQLLGSRSDVPELMRKAAVVVMTSAPDTEGMPGVLIEAGLSGIPVVTTLAAGVADVVEDGRTGWIVLNSRPEELAARIRLLIEDPRLRKVQGAAARERCVERFSIDATAHLWRDLVAVVLASCSARGAEIEQLGEI